MPVRRSRFTGLSTWLTSHVEVYTDPGLVSRTDYRVGQEIPLIIEGQEVARIAVADLLP